MHQVIDLQDLVNELSFEPLVQIALWEGQNEIKMTHSMKFLAILLELAYLPPNGGKFFFIKVTICKSSSKNFPRKRLDIIYNRCRLKANINTKTALRT